MQLGMKLVSAAVDLLLTHLTRRINSSGYFPDSQDGMDVTHYMTSFQTQDGANEKITGNYACVHHPKPSDFVTF
jgi:hypothetical protein